MPSTYSTSLRLELMGAGEQAANWGNTTNYNLGTLLEQAIAGVENVTISGTSYTLTTGSGVSDQARNAVINLIGTLSANCNVIVPSVDKVYTIRNSTTGGFSVVVKTAAGSGVTVANGLTQSMYCDATNVVASAVAFNNATNTIASNVTGNVTGNVTAGAGSAAAPSVTFGDTDTGVYGPTAGEIGFTLNGTELLRLSGSALSYSSGSNNVSLSNDGAIEITKNGGGAYIDFKGAAGEDADARIFETSNGIGFQTGGNGTIATRMVITSTGQIQSVGSGTAAAPAYGFSGDTNTGIFSPAADQLALSLGGVQFVTVSGTAIGFGVSNPGYPVTIQANASTGALRIVGRAADDISTMEFGNSTQTATNAIIQSGPGYLSFGPSGTEQARVDNTGAFRFNSGYGSVATAFGCRAWVNFNGTGAVAIRASGNVSSITDNGTGDYTVNFTTNMPDANYAIMVSHNQQSTGNRIAGSSNVSTVTGCQITIEAAGTTWGSNRSDPSSVFVAIFR